MKRHIAICAIAAACLCRAASAQKAKPAEETAAKKAAALYQSAVSAIRTGQWKQAEGLLDRYVKSCPSHEYVPVGYLQLAHCRHQLKDEAGCEAAVDEVIRRFDGSPAWFNAYGWKLARAKAGKDNDGYLLLLESMLRAAGEAPWQLHGVISWQFGDYWHQEYHGRHFEPTAGWLGSISQRPGWVMDILQMADTPEPAARALRALAGNFHARAKELPPDWQYAHATLLRRAGKPDEAEKALSGYFEAWGDDPRAIDLWLLKAQEAQARPDQPAVDAAYDHLVEKYAGAGSLEEALHQYLAGLQAQDRYDRFTRLARQYLGTYTTSPWWGYVVSYWVGMAKRKAEAGDTSRIASALKMLDDVYDAKTPARQRTKLIWKIDLLMLSGKADQAAELARRLLGEDHWSAESYDLVSRYAAKHKPFAAVVDAARERWSIPLPNPTSKAFVLLDQLKRRVQDEQMRHAEEIGEEMFSEHRDDAATIQAVKLLADYYFKKVLAEPRDKWMDRMVQAYPHHPLTQAVMVNQIATEGATRRYDRLAVALDTIEARFPATAGRWYHSRMRCYESANDPGGAHTYARRIHGPSADAGDVRSLAELAKYDLAGYGQDYKAIGDYWMERARKLTGTRAQLYCLSQALRGYYWGPYLSGRRNQVQWEPAAVVLQELRNQSLDPELGWKLGFADVNLLAHKGDGQAALEALEGRLKDGQTCRDLSLRLDLVALGSALGSSKLLRKGHALAGRLERLCFTSRDAAAIELMQAAMFAARQAYGPAAEHYLKVVQSSPCPARMYPYFAGALNCLRQGKGGRYTSELDAYIRRISHVQELVPGLLYQAGEYYLQTRNAAALSVRQKLASRYPASAARDRMDELFAQYQKQAKK